MNSDPHDSAAWRTFGMLDADEAAAFDEALRHDPDLRKAFQEMDALTAAVAVCGTVSIVPRAGQLERLHLRLGLNASKSTNWAGITGWAAAAVLTMVLILDRNPERTKSVAEVSDPEPAVFPANPTRAAAVEDGSEIAEVAEDNEAAGDLNPQQTALVEIESRTVGKVETKRLIQEISELRDKLESLEERDRERFEAVAGLASPVVMRMRPPGAVSEIQDGRVLKKEEPPLVAMLGDALLATGPIDMGRVGSFYTPPVAPEPTAIPIYDPARDEGTIVINGFLPPKANDESYQLWVLTENGGSPIYVGTLPESENNGADIFDFNLGTKSTIPKSFVLTKGRQGEPLAPSKNNTVLQGPQ